MLEVLLPLVGAPPGGEPTMLALWRNQSFVNGPQEEQGSKGGDDQQQAAV